MMKLERNRKPPRWPYVLVTVIVALAALVGGLLYFRPRALARAVRSIERIELWRAWFDDPQAHQSWAITGGERCGDAPMLLPTTGFIGVDYGDSFRPGHNHSGYDIFSADGVENVTPIVAAYDGYLTRESDWLSTVIIRHPDFPAVVPGEQIWTYYTHMASADGEQSYVAAAFPPGTYDLFVTAGTLLGHQGTWSGTPNRPTGLHLHFSIVRTLSGGGYANETDINNTLDPAPFLGVQPGQDNALTCPPE